MNPDTAVPQVLTQRETARKGGQMGYTTRNYPRVRGGLCDACGVIDKNQPSHMQYKLCPHYRGMSLECNYCESTKDQNEVARISVLKIYDHPHLRDSQGRPMLGVVCDSYLCTDQFRSEFGQ